MRGVVLAATQSETPVPPKSDFETWPSKRQRMAEKSSLRGEAKMPPPQASGKRREFDPLQGSEMDSNQRYF
jgi:hypothetical protein